MVIRKEYKCEICDEQYYLRLAVGKAFSHKFRYNCPKCNNENHGEMIVEYRNTDGTIIPTKDWNEMLRISGSRKLEENSIVEDIAKAITIYPDLPIIDEQHITTYSTQVVMPMFQIIQMMGMSKMKEYTQLLQDFYNIPENDFWVVRNCDKNYRDGKIDVSRRLLEKISPNIPEDDSRIPSECGKLYNVYFMKLLGYSKEISEHINIMDSAGKKHNIRIFEIPKSILELNVIDHILQVAFDFSEEVFNSKVMLSIGRYLEYIDYKNKPKHRLTHDYPELFFHIYEQGCELLHYYIKIHIGYLNLLHRNNINSFYNSSFRSYAKYFKNAKLFQSIELIAENEPLNNLYGNCIDRDIRNGIAHRSISFSKDGQKILLRKKNRDIIYDHDEVLVQVINICRTCINGYSIITDIYRLISDKLWEKKFGE